MLTCLLLFNTTSTTEFYPLSLHDALPILRVALRGNEAALADVAPRVRGRHAKERARGRDHVLFHEHVISAAGTRSEEHTSELQSLRHLVCRLLLEKKK